MSEAASRPPETNTTPAKIFEFKHRTPETIDPSELSEAELVDFFFSYFRHPSTRKQESAVIAQQAYEYLGEQGVEDLSPSSLAWRDAMRQISADIPDEAYDEMLDTDEVFADIEGLLRSTRDHAKDFRDQRRVLAPLLEFRYGAVGKDIAGDDEDWEQLLELLFRRGAH